MAHRPATLAVRDVALDIGTRRLLEHVDLEIEPGSFVAIVGPNGIGKTTLLRALAGFTAPAAGSIVLDGLSVSAMSHRARAQRIAALGADPEPPSAMSVREVALCGRFARHTWWDWARGKSDETAVENALARVGLSAFAQRSFDTLSSGERQRAWIAVALAQGADVLLLDEPTSHLDVRYALEVLAVLRRIAHDGATVVAVLHDLNEAAAFADRIALLGAGRVLGYDAPGIVLEPTLLERAYGVPFSSVEVTGVTRVFAHPDAASIAP